MILRVAKRKPQGRPGAVQQLALEAERGFRRLALPAPVASAHVENAQSRLAAACAAVNNVLLTVRLSRAVDRAIEKKDLRGRLADTQLDVLRSAIVFAGAGLDAALKELIRTSILPLAQTSTLAKKKYLTFVAMHLAAPDSPISRTVLAEVLTATDGAQAELLNRYERYLTGDSLQSAAQVDGVCSALGIDDRRIRQRLRPDGLLDQMFHARNEIVHELDLLSKGRRLRKVSDVESFAREALEVTQEIINHVATALGKPRAAT